MNLEKIDLLNEESVYVTNYTEKASHFRGRIIDSTISLEMKLAGLLSEFFNRDEIKRKFMLSSIFTNSDLSFSSKAHIFSEILNQFYPELLAMYPGLSEDLTTLINLRNRIDHSMIDTSPEFIKHRYSDRIQLIFFKEGLRSQMVITDEDFNSGMTKGARMLIVLDSIKSRMNLN